MGKIITSVFLASILSSPAMAVECTTSTPVTAQVVTDATAAVDGGGTYNAVGTATCPDQQGPKGDKGDTGSTGAKGDTGEAGHKGDKGDTGSVGATGATGSQGIAGAKGDKGDKGDTGAQGVAGVAGPKGDKGATGAIGLTGAPGAVINLDKYEANIAAAGAIAIPHVDPGKKFAVSGGFSDTGNSAAFSINGALRFNDTWQAGVGFSSSANGDAHLFKGTVMGQF